MNASEALGEPPRHRAGQGRKARGSRDDGHAGGAGAAVEGRYPGDEVAGVGEIDIGNAEVDTGTRNAIVTCLERPGGVDDQIESLRCQHRADIAFAIHRQRPGIFELGAEGGRLASGAAGDEKMMAGRRQAPAESGAEAAIAADDENPAHSRRSLRCAGGRQQASRRPNRP